MLLHDIPSRIALNHTFNDDVKLNHDGRSNHLTNFECVLVWHFSKVKGETCEVTYDLFVRTEIISQVYGYNVLHSEQIWVLLRRLHAFQLMMIKLPVNPLNDGVMTTLCRP